MPPKKISLSQLSRFPYWEAVEAGSKMGLEFPKNSLDLEVRAMVARKMHGGTPVRGFEGRRDGPEGLKRGA